MGCFMFCFKREVVCGEVEKPLGSKCTEAGSMTSNKQEMSLN
jgi:hypothetical protein